MSAQSFQVVPGISKPKLLVTVAAALLLSACSSAMERFAENPSDADPVYTASVPKSKSAGAAYSASDDDDNGISSKPLANASPQQPVYNYGSTAKTPAYKQPQYGAPKVPQVAETEPPSAPAGGKVTVGSGMTLYSIARANNVTVSELAAANNIKAPYSVHTGQILRIPGRTEAVNGKAPFASKAAASSAAAGQHQVASGETLFSLGRKYGVSPYAIAEANGLSHNSQLAVGQKVRIPGAAAGSAPVVAQKAPKQMPKPGAEPEVADSGASDAVATQQPDAQPSVVPEPAPQQVAEAVPADSAATGMRWPVRGKVISSFGSKPNGLKNEGINIAVPEGTSIRAAEGGVVAYAGNELKGYGNLVLVRHEGGYVTAYAHAKELFVKRGDTVKRGDVIAKAGQTGSVSSPQLHFEVRKGATALDPMKFLSSATASN